MSRAAGPPRRAHGGLRLGRSGHGPVSDTRTCPWAAFSLQTGIRRAATGQVSCLAPDTSRAWHRTRLEGPCTLYPWGVYSPGMSEITTYSVPGMHCGHCERAVTEEVSAVAGVTAVGVDLETKLVSVTGPSFDDAAVRAAIEEAGYQAA